MARAGIARIGHSSGFSLVEALVATTIMVVAVAALAQLVAMSTRANASARATTYAAVLAQQKMEQLRGLAWGFDSLGLPLTDTSTDVTVVPERASGGKGLSPSPSGSLTRNVDGYCDFVDANGRSLGGGSTPPPETAYIRRWTVEPLPTDPTNTVVLQVRVRRLRNRGAPGDDVNDVVNDVNAGKVSRLPDEARMVTVKTRKAM